MLFLHDVWVNYSEGKEMGYDVHEFHEWKKEDTVQLMDSVPLFKVTNDLYDYILNGMNEIPQELLDKVKGLARIRLNHQLHKLDYCFVITNGLDAFVVDTDGSNVPKKKSRLMPRQTHLALDTLEYNEKPRSFGYEKKDFNLDQTLPQPLEMIGLTRREREMKMILHEALKTLTETTDVAKLRYFYTELKPNEYEQIKTMKLEDLQDKLHNNLRYGWSKEHEEACRELIKGNKELEIKFKVLVKAK